MYLESQQAFVADFIAQSFGLPIAHENANYTPTPGTAWVRLRTFTGDITAGSISADISEGGGFLQFELNFPEGVGAMTAKIQLQTIFDAFPLSRRVSYGGESFRVTALQQFDASPQGGWFQVVGRIFFEKD